MVGDRPHTLLHVTQIASLVDLDLPRDVAAPSTRMAWDGVTILEGWLDLLQRMDLDLMLEALRPGGLATRNLAVNVFHLFEQLGGAWDEGAFEWHTKEADAARSARLTTAGDVRAYARACLSTFCAFLLGRQRELDAADPPVAIAGRGTTPFSVLVHAQRAHAAIHHRQVLDFLERRGVPTAGALDVDAIAGLDLPRDLY